MSYYATLVRRHFMAHDGGIYECDSYDPRCGLWMTWIGGKPVPKKDRRRNVSERVVGRTFHLMQEGEMNAPAP